MNRKLKKQIKAYAGVAGAILSAEKLNAQVIYVDVNPDTLVEIVPCDTSTKTFDIDIDNDAVFDFRFFIGVNCYYSTISNNGFFDRRFIEVIPFNNNEIERGSYYCYPYPSGNGNILPMPKKLTQGDLIDANGNWNAAPGFLWTHFSEYDSVSCCPGGYLGVWKPPNFGEGCLPFILNKNSNIYFGWMHIKVLTHSSFILKDYAYQLHPNSPIFACDTTDLATGISENNSQFSFSQQNNSIHISTFQNLNHVNICVYDLLGKEILQQPFEGKETTFTIDKKGIYFVEVISEKGVSGKKVFIY